MHFGNTDMPARMSCEDENVSGCGILSAEKSTWIHGVVETSSDFAGPDVD